MNFSLCCRKRVCNVISMVLKRYFFAVMQIKSSECLTTCCIMPLFTVSPNTAITITAELRTEEIRIRFENHGNTISKERLSQIFQQFYRMEPEKNTDSMGVNLAIAKQIAELHKGSISARSRDGISQFTVTLPVS